MIEIGNVVEGKVVSVMPFGAFVDIDGNRSGLVHISEISSGYVKDINECVKKGDIVRVKVIRIDESGKISLSIKQAEDKKERKERRERFSKNAYDKNAPVRPAVIDWDLSASEGMSFEDMLSKFKQDSDEKNQTLRRNNDSKRSGGYSRKSNHSF